MKSIKKILISKEFLERHSIEKTDIESMDYYVIELLNTMEINRNGQFILTKSKIGEMKFETKVTVPEGVTDLLEGLARVIEEADWEGFEKKEATAEEDICNVRVEYYNAEPIEFRTKYGQDSMPKNWFDFGEKVNEWIGYYGYKPIIDTDGFVHYLKEGEVIYLSCTFDDELRGKTYYYRTLNDLIREGDEVVVPVGETNRESRAWVAKKEFFKPEDVPMSMGRVKEIIRRVEDEEHDEVEVDL